MINENRKKAWRNNSTMPSKKHVLINTGYLDKFTSSNLLVPFYPPPSFALSLLEASCSRVDVIACGLLDCLRRAGGWFDCFSLHSHNSQAKGPIQSETEISWYRTSCGGGL